MPFTRPLLLILVFQLILFHTIVTVGHYMLCSIENFVLKKRAVDCDVKGHTSVGVYRVDIMFCLASSVSFGSFKNLTLSSQRLLSLSFKTTTVHINLLE